ncbi:hypothetical protein ACFYWD_33695 [Streptomyces sp. NPDC003781]|uniref:hypothetical protein n=1 Tax=Streptomyces sp. NPDC003781 TaxID=3364686 RepID=UPI003685CC33
MSIRPPRRRPPRVAVVAHPVPGGSAARPIPVRRLTVTGVRRPRGGGGDAVPRGRDVAEPDDAGRAVRLAAAPADLARILRALGAARAPATRLSANSPGIVRDP